MVNTYTHIHSKAYRLLCSSSLDHTKMTVKERIATLLYSNYLREEQGNLLCSESEVANFCGPCINYIVHVASTMVKSDRSLFVSLVGVMWIPPLQ